MGIPIIQRFSSSEHEFVPISHSLDNATPSTLSLLTRSLSPDRLRIFLQALLSSFPSTSQHEAILQLLVDSVPRDSPLTPSNLSRSNIVNWSNERIENALSQGTNYILTESPLNDNQMRWSRRASQEPSRARPDFNNQVNTILDSTRNVSGNRPSSDVILQMLTRDIEDSIFQSLATEMARLGRMRRERDLMLQEDTNEGESDDATVFEARL